MGSKSSSSSQTSNTTIQSDERIAADNGAIAFNVDGDGASTSLAFHNTTTDPGLVDFADEVSTNASLQVASAIAANVKAAEQLSQVAGAALSNIKDVARDSIDAQRSATRETLGANKDVTRFSFDFSEDVVSKTYEGMLKAFERSFDFAEDAGQHSTGFATEFVRDFYSANQDEAERNFERISQLATAAVIVLGLAWYLKGR